MCFEHEKTNQFIKFVDELYYTNYLPQRVLNGHTQNRFMFERSIIINTGIKSWIIVGVWDVDSLIPIKKQKRIKYCGHVSHHAVKG